jgi:hypothetical protein
LVQWPSLFIIQDMFFVVATNLGGWVSLERM